MGLKPDHWIKKMAEEHGMIEPFIDKQVREGAISYGVSSYGYDLRVSDEFKIFTNVHSAIVDPKNFASDSFVDFKGDVCIIPPNSFALARSIEYFRIPRQVLTICLGKSTYARCFRGDTRVALVDGTNPTLEEMARRSEDGEMFWGYSIGQYGRIIVTLLEAPRLIGQDALLEITLDNGEKICCTPDHEFISRDGQLLQAHELRPETALMPLYRSLHRGYEMVYQPLTGHLYPTHRLADEWNLNQDIYQDIPDTHRHHLDLNRLNNNPWNIERWAASEHIRFHNQNYYDSEDFDPEEHGQSIKEALERLSQDEEWKRNYSRTQSENALNFWHSPDHSEKRKEWVQKNLASWAEERRIEYSQRLTNFYKNPTNRLRQGQISKATCARDVKSVSNYKNHKVISIRELKGANHDVYCLTVPEAGNFALASGVFVRNCGLIVNVTPFEPEWEGFVTLEISNTTPLPAKVYANEGLAQVLFFEADEPCDQSYADKKGKYQGQTGVTPPRM